MNWTYEGYWNAVLGVVSASEIVAEHGLVAGDRRGLDEWLGQAEAEAWRVGGQGGRVPSEWAEHHAKALAELVEACAEGRGGAAVTPRAVWVHSDGSTEHSAAGPLGCFLCSNARRAAAAAAASPRYVANKRPPVLVGGKPAAMLDDMPKAMLMDLVADLLRASLGEDVAEAELCAAIAAAADPVARAPMANPAAVAEVKHADLAAVVSRPATSIRSTTLARSLRRPPSAKRAASRHGCSDTGHSAVRRRGTATRAVPCFSLVRTRRRTTRTSSSSRRYPSEQVHARSRRR
jgi:hypothetical protein